MVSDDTGPELLDVGRSRDASGVDTVQTATSRRGLMAVAVVVVLALAGLAALDSTADEPADDAAIEIEEEERARDDRVDDTSSRTSQTSWSPITSSSTASSSTKHLDRAVLADDTGYSLILGGDTNLRRFDLDTGTLTTFEQRGAPMLVTGDFLVFQTSEGSVRALPINDMQADPAMLGDQQIGRGVSSARQPGHIWSVPWNMLDGQADLVDLASGEIVVSIDLATTGIDLLNDGFVAYGSGLDVVNGRTGGIFVLDDGAFERRLDGRAVAVGNRLALIETCDDRLRCERAWIDLETFGTVERPPPPFVGYAAHIVGDDRWLITIDARTWRPTITEIATGAAIEIETDYVEAFAVSPDGEWLAYWSGRELVVMNLSTRESVSLAPSDLEMRSGWIQLVFVPTTAFD